jgi:hypothetical protein
LVARTNLAGLLFVSSVATPDHDPLLTSSRYSILTLGLDGG